MTRQAALVALILVILSGFALRLLNLDASPFRGDEAFAAQYWAGQPLATTLATIAPIEPHPPLNYALFRGWALLAGIDEFTLRLLPTLFNLLGVPALYALGKRLDGRRLGLLAALLWAVNPYQVWHAQDARNYAIWAGLSAVSLWLGLRVIQGGRRLDWAAYLLSALAAALVFYLELFMLAAVTVCAIISRWCDGPFIRRWLAVQAMVVAGALLAFWRLQGGLLAAGAYGGTIGAANLREWWWFLPTLAFGDTLPADFVKWISPVLLVVSTVSLLVVWHYDRRRGLFLASVGVAPVILLVLASLRIDVRHPRYVLPVTAAHILLFASLVLLTQRRFTRASPGNAAAIVLLAAWLGVSGYSLFGYFFTGDYMKSSDWPALTTYLRENVRPDDLVIQTGVDAAFGYYYDAAAMDIALPAAPQQPVGEITAQLEASRAQYRSIWVVGRTFSDWPNAGEVERWAQENMQRVRSTLAAGLPVQQFMTWEVHEREIEPTPLANFDDVAELVGSQVFQRTEPTGELTVWLYWHPIATTQSPLKIFAHLIGPINPATGTPLWAQDDQYPQDGHANTSSWSPGTIYRDVYSIPAASVPPGDYSLVIGFYEPETNRRIPIAGGDSYTLARVTLP